MRRIKRNAWDNCNGYEGTRRVIEFGCDERAAKAWFNAPIIAKLYRVMKHVHTLNEALPIADVICKLDGESR